MVLGRVDELIVSGGVKVSLAEVQACARTLPGLGDAVVVPVGRGAWGEAPAIVSTGAGPDDLEAVRAVIGARLGAAARPVALVRVEAIPMLASGKPDLAAIRALV